MGHVLAAMMPENRLVMETCIATGLRASDVLNLRNAGKIWVFEGRTDYTKHRTRQAVYRDVRLCAAFFQRSGVVPRGATIGTHTGRKMAAVREMQRTGDIEAVGRLLNHSGRDKAVTMLYALADQLTAAKLEGKGGHLHE